MQCRNCGSQIPDGARFCPVCGADQTAIAPPQQGYVPPRQNDPSRQIYPQQPPYASAPQHTVPAPKKKSKAPVVILAVTIGLVILAAAVFVLLRFVFVRPGPLPQELTEPAETTNAGTEAQKGDAVPAKYSPGNYVQHAWGDYTLYDTPDSTWENSFFAETEPGQLAEIAVTEVQKNPNAQSEYDLWRGKTTVDGKTGWVNLFEWTCTDVRETALTPAEEEQVFRKLQGAWRYHSGNQLIEFAENENGERWVTSAGNHTAIPEFSCEMLGTGIMYGNPSGLVRIILTTMQGYERELLVDLTLADANEIPTDPAQERNREITWNFFGEGWFWSYYAGTSIEDAGPFGGGAY